MSKNNKKREVWVDEFGKRYYSYEDYCNSPDLDPDIIYDYLALGYRTPQNEMEKKWAEEGKRLLKEGGYDISFN